MPTEHATRNHRGLPDPNHTQQQIPDGNYFGKWSGHTVILNHAGQDLEFPVNLGTRSFQPVDCILTIRGGRAVKVEVVDVNRNKLPS